MNEKPTLPTYDGLGDVVVKMTQTIEINNLRYEQGKKYKLPYWIAKELSGEGYCWYVIKPEDFLKLKSKEIKNELRSI